MDEILENLRMKCERECRERKNRKKREKYRRDKEEQKLLKKNANLQAERIGLDQFLSRLKNKAESKNETGMLSAKEDFKLGLQHFRGIEMSTAVKEKMEKLEDLIKQTFKMYTQDVEKLCQIADKILSQTSLEKTSLRKSEEDIEGLFKPILGLERQTEEHFYTIRNDWHDIRLRIDLALSEIAKAIGIIYQRVFECSWVVGTCPKCIATQERDSNEKQPTNKSDTQTLIRKRKPINFTMEDLEAATDDNDSDFEI